MATLSAHLRHPEAHAGLPFHPDCPMCRDERLVGTLMSGGPISRRTQAALAAGVLAFTATAPAALAAEGDGEQDGTAAVTDSADSSQSPDFDPGGSSDDLPAQAPALPETPAAPTDGNDDTGAIDEEPVTNANDPVVDPGDGADAQGSQPQAPAPVTADDATPTSAPSDQAATQTPAPVPSATAPPPPTPSTAGALATSQTGGAPRNERTAQRHRRHRSHRSARIVVHRTKTAAPATVPTTTPAPAVAPTAVTRSPAASVAAADRARSDDRTHTVQAGESLWSIAGDLLGSDAAPARIAREVSRLWELNGQRIGTGNPDLLMIGTTLRLR